MNPTREKKFRSVIKCRQPNLTVVLENVHDSHNIGAVLRSCDSIGIKEIYVLNNVETLTKDALFLGKRTSAGARKWVDVHFYKDTQKCFEAIRKKYDKIMCTHLSEDAVGLYEMELSGSLALLFGNEHLGVTAEVLKKCDGNFIIPQVGMVESLNISVACAVTLYEAFRQRKLKGYYSDNPLLSKTQQTELFEVYNQRHVQKHKPKKAFKIE